MVAYILCVIQNFLHSLMARKKRSFLSPSKTQERLKKQLYQKKGSKRRKKSTLLKNIKAFFAFLFPYFKVSAAIKNELSGIFFCPAHLYYGFEYFG